MLSVICPDMLETEVLMEKVPVLIAFLKKNKWFSEQIKILEDISERFDNQLKVCLADEFFLKTFFEQFGFGGTPFYLFFYKGIEKRRFFGYADRTELIQFVKTHVE